MDALSLDGDWKLAYFPSADKIIQKPEDFESTTAPIMDARVPGNVELDLHRAGIIPEPFFGKNIQLLRPYEYYEWWYSKEFDVPVLESDAAWELVFEGLDTIATIWLNSMEVGHSENMLIEHRFDITRALQANQANRLVVRIESSLNVARTFHYDVANSGPDGREESLHIRRAPHTGGWDIMPRAFSSGIWRSVSIAKRPVNAIEQMYYWTSNAREGDANVGVRFQFRTDARDLDGFSIQFHGVCGDHEFAYEWHTEFIAGGCQIPVPGARLWWPKGYGDPNLYTVTAKLIHKGDVLAERMDTIGIRDMKIDRTLSAGPEWSPGPQGEGRYDTDPDPANHFVVYVNNIPILAKGSNWVPLDAFHSRDRDRVEKALDMFDDLGCNIIRCWGGNVYEDHAFFDYCDKHGMMVWQDFAFACGRYPQTEDFLNKVRIEAERVVCKLRNHASLMLWCGDNEVDALYIWDGGPEPEHNRITREVLPEVVRRCDPRRHFVPSSPYLPPNQTGNTPEQHLWGPRSYYRSSFYMRHSAHFIGEMGYHGCPNVSAIKQFISEDKLWPWQDNEEWKVHNTYHWRHNGYDRDRIKLMANQIKEVFGVIPGNLDDFALASQIVQAEAKKFFIESTRLRKWQTSGIIWWNVLDGWPQFSDAIVDYYWGKKLAYHYIWRVQRPICVIVGESGSEKYRPVIISNDSREHAEVSYRVWDADTKQNLAEGKLMIPANQNWQVARLRTSAEAHRLYLIEWTHHGEIFGNHYLKANPPLNLEEVRGWLKVISDLPRKFNPDQVAK